MIRNNNAITTGWIIALAMLTTSALYAQTDLDALRYSRLRVAGSGRTMGVGGAFGALGADFTVLSTNPAGIAKYRHSEVSITPSLKLNETTTSFDENNITEAAPRFNVGNLGVVFSEVNENRASKWKTVNFALGTNRLANFDQRFSYAGTSEGSITARFVEQANGKTLDQLSDFEEGLAYDAYLIDLQPGSDDQYFTDADSTDRVFKSQEFDAQGHYNEFVLSLGGNYMHRLYLGATIGIPFIRYNEYKLYREEDIEGTIPNFNSLTFREQFSTTGVGINLKVGAIYRVNQMLRLGLAAHTPTLLTLTDNFSNAVTSSMDLIGTTGEVETFAFDEESDFGIYEYRLRTPWRLIGSAAAIIGKKGFITGELEYVDYGQAQFNFRAFNDADRAYQETLNTTITNKYGSAINMRLGGEIVLDNFRLRGGYAVYASPFEAGVAREDAILTSYSLGLGYHSKGVFVDMAWVRSGNTEEFVPYTLNDPQQMISVANRVNATQMVLTVGFKFY